ncbi:MAG TPA: hypothetical protein VKV04_02555 [Verrucomicrobiae bacterium]|nr:hypothetical protein [Verrucomicrobiae bacterium]
MKDEEKRHAISILKGDDPRYEAFLAAALKDSNAAEVDAGFEAYCATLTNDAVGASAKSLIQDDGLLADVLKEHLEFIGNQLSAKTAPNDKRKDCIEHAYFIVQNVLQAVMSELPAAADFFLELNPVFAWLKAEQSEPESAQKAIRSVLRRLRRHGFDETAIPRWATAYLATKQESAHATDLSLGTFNPIKLIQNPLSHGIQHLKPCFLWQGRQWQLHFDDEQGYVEDTLGMRYLGYLIRNANQDFSAFQLQSAVESIAVDVSKTRTFSGKKYSRPHKQQGIEDLDLQDAKHNLEDSQLELERAKKNHDEPEIKWWQQEVETCLKEIKRLTNPHTKKASDSSSTMKKANDAVSKAIKAAVKNISKGGLPKLSKQLSSVKRRSYFKYCPAHGVSWEIFLPGDLRPQK